MSVSVSYPGVYIQELPSGVSTIVGVATSIGAFVDTFASGPLNTPTQLLSFGDFQRAFGGLSANSEASYAIQQFFLNGGTEAYAVRVTSATAANAAKAAAIGLAATNNGAAVVIATALNPGLAGSSIVIDIDYGTLLPATQFNLTVTQFATVNGVNTPTATEVYRNLVQDSTQPNDAMAMVNANSQLIQLSAETKGARPAQTGTTSGPLTTIAAAGLAGTETVTVALNGTTVGTTPALGGVPASFGALATTLQAQIRALSGGQATLPNATVSVVGSSSSQAWLVVDSGNAAAGDVVALTDAGGGLATKLGFASATQNVQHYALGGTAAQAQVLAGTQQQAGSDGTWDPVGDAAGVALGLIGDANAKTGIYALLDVDLFNILCVPATMNLPDTQASSVITAATALCTQRRAMFLVDVPQQAAVRDTVPAIQAWLDANAGLRSSNAALYFPRADIADPLAGLRLRKVAPSGTVAGLYARIDGTRGVWKAPAGTEATLTGVQQLEYKLTDPENGVLNPQAINCLRVFPTYGPVCWGARTLNGADQMEDQYKYLPVRRLALYIEESLYRGTQWAVFEPNATPLWSQLRLNIGTFMQTLFRQGAFAGTTPQTAYFVMCDASTNPQSSIDLGIVNVLVGFAPLYPAEFVVIQIQQMAGQLGT
jgi:phage tail sheath protein FI